ncbi:MAG: ABC transporter substrate-binding protein [Proteobacteria bacterium]|nr:ABC transporter substrate-binding protein [Pseudomonadota bacterium]
MIKKTELVGSCFIIVFCLLLGRISQASETIKVAAIFAKSGDAKTADAMIFSGLHFAVAEINNKGGLLGKTVKLIEIDNKSTALGSKAAAEKAVKEGAIAVIGGSRSSQALAMAPVLQAAHIPMISTSATIPELTAAGDYIFRTCFVDDFQGEIMATFALRDLNAKTAVVLTNTGNKYSLGLAKVFIEQYKKAGGEILMEGEYLEDVTDFEALLKKVKALDPKVVFVPGYFKDTGKIMKKSEELGIKQQYLGGDGWGEDLLYEYAGDAAEGSYTCSHWNRSNADLLSRRFTESFEKTYGRITSFAVPLAYDAATLLADAITRANSFDPPKIRDALAATQDFKGVTGDITLDKNRDPVNKAAVILKYEKSATVYFKTYQP